MGGEKGDCIDIHVRFKGRDTRSIKLPLPLSAPDACRTPRQIVEEIDRFLYRFTDAEVAREMNARGFTSGNGKLFNAQMVRYIRNAYKLKDCCTRLRESGLLTKYEVAERLGIGPRTVLLWHRQGLLEGVVHDDRGGCLFRMPADNLPLKGKHKHVWLESNVDVMTGQSGI